MLYTIHTANTYNICLKLNKTNYNGVIFQKWTIF